MEGWIGCFASFSWSTLCGGHYVRCQTSQSRQVDYGRSLAHLHPVSSGQRFPHERGFSFGPYPILSSTSHDIRVLVQWTVVHQSFIQS
ncbi:hypothetical protein IW262DRAFT_1496622 [Armillaria fumosa]|nr:hypothetical protein IW262DRAFT_1496622 [Armillaria fumosa]